MTKKLRILGIISLSMLIVVMFAFFTVFHAKGEETQKTTDVFTMSVGTNQENYAFPSMCGTSTPVGASDSGIAFFHEKGKLSFSYDNAINFKSMTKNHSLIEFYAIMGEKNAILENITITLTDTEDSDNSISYYAFYQYNDGGAIYCRTQYLGKDLAEGGRNDNPWNAEYGRWATGSGFYYLTRSNKNLPWEAWSETKKVYPLSFYLDYEEKATYVQKRSGTNFESVLILDLDKTSVIGEGAEWKGFTNDTAYLSVEATFSNIDFDGGIIIKSITGFNVGGTFTDQSSYPIPKVDVDITSDYITTEQDKMILPNGYVGIKYPIPSVRAFDWFFADNQAIDYKVVKVDTETDCTSQVVEDCFVADQEGEYKIVYTISNGKQSVNKDYYLNVFANEEPIMIGLENPFDKAEIGNMFTVPQTIVFGGSKVITKTEKLYYNGTLVDFDATRKIMLDKAGDLILSVECQCYGGSSFVRNFNIKVSNTIIMTIDGFPKIIKTGEDLQLPLAKAVNSLTGEDVDVEITFDGADVSDDRIVYTDKTEGMVKVTYKAVCSLGEKVLEYDLKVVNPDTALPSDYFIAYDDSIKFGNSENGIEFSANATSTITWGYPVVTGYASEKMTVALYGIVGKSNFGYLDVILTDCQDKYSQSTIRIFNSNNSQTMLEVDGVKYQTNGSFFDGNSASRIGFYIKNNTLYQSLNDKVMCKLSIAGAKTCFVSFKLGEISGDAGASLFILGNQNMDLVYDGEWRDRIVPVISFDKQFDSVSEFSKGATVTIPSLKVYDMFNSSSSATLRVLDPQGEIVYTSANLSQENSFTLDKVGKYTIMFNLSDNNKASGAKTYYCDSLDVVNPILSIEGSIPQSLLVGTKVIIPKASASDDVDGNVDVIIYVKYLKDGKVRHVDGGSGFTFELVGKYEIVYVARDNSYNYTTYRMPIDIKETTNEK